RVDDAREHLRMFCTLNVAATKLQGKSTNISQTIFGQWLDEYALNEEEVGRVRVVLGLSPREQIGPLLSLVRENPDNTAAAIGLIYALRLSGLLESVGGLAKGAMIPERIIQFWDSLEVTPDIQRLMNSWGDKNPGYEYVLFNDETARRFLQENFTADVFRAYVRVKEPAQKSDIFRLAYLAKEGGVYVDADDFCLAPLAGLIAPQALLALYQEDHGTVGNNFIAVVPQHPIILEALAQVVLAVNRGDGDMPWLSTGPALLTRSIAQHIANSKLSYSAVVERLVVLNRREFSQKVAIHCLAAYKETNRHWSNSTFAVRKGGVK
ncbi:MAG: glycosyltransferase, partial [Anaerolineaceae bacterium]|nr:glycosyltransferase [Anaerolineaceae bacterium]